MTKSEIDIRIDNSEDGIYTGTCIENTDEFGKTFKGVLSTFKGAKFIWIRKLSRAIKETEQDSYYNCPYQVHPKTIKKLNNK